MLWGFSLVFLTGLVWSAVGSVYSHAAERRGSIYSFLVLGTLAFILLSWGGGCPAAVTRNEVIHVAMYMIPIGICTQLGLWLLCMAMRSGENSIAWSISQSAMICPFLAGAILSPRPGAWLSWVGVAMMAASFFLLAKKGENTVRARMFLPYCALSFFMIGFGGVLTLLPTLNGQLSAEALSWRVPLLSFSGLVWLIPIFCRKEKFNWKMWKLAALYGTIVTVGQMLVYAAIDQMARVGAAGIVYPLATGTCVVGFYAYCYCIRKEKTDRWQFIGILLTTLGMALLATY